MRIARLTTSHGPRHAVAAGDDWRIVVDPFADPVSYTGEVVLAADATFLAPVLPRVLVGIAHNRGINDHPLPIQAWHKSVHSVAGHDDTIVQTPDAGGIGVEGELAVVIGRTASALTEENALDHVLGYTIGNDVTNADQVALDEKNFQSKAGRNYTPLGPWIETDIVDPENVATTVSVNGVTRAESGSFNLPSTVVASIVYVTRWLTLEPGDVILTGAPKTFVPVQPGDVAEVTLAGIGTLRNAIAGPELGGPA